MTRRSKDTEVTRVSQVLLDALGARILSRLTEADGPLGSYTWPEPGDPGPDAPQAARVRLAFAVWQMLEPQHGSDFVIDWLLTINPLVGQRPADAIADDDFAAVLVAAQMVRDADALDEEDDEEDDE